jgi:hypothetical protein
MLPRVQAEFLEVPNWAKLPEGMRFSTQVSDVACDSKKEEFMSLIAVLIPSCIVTLTEVSKELSERRRFSLRFTTTWQKPLLSHGNVVPGSMDCMWIPKITYG